MSEWRWRAWVSGGGGHEGVEVEGMSEWRWRAWDSDLKIYIFKIVIKRKLRFQNNAKLPGPAMTQSYICETRTSSQNKTLHDCFVGGNVYHSWIDQTGGIAL